MEVLNYEFATPTPAAWIEIFKRRLSLCRMLSFSRCLRYWSTDTRDGWIATQKIGGKVIFTDAVCQFLQKGAALTERRLYDARELEQFKWLVFFAEARLGAPEATRDDAAGFPERWAAEHGTPQPRLNEWLGAQPPRKAVRTLKDSRPGWNLEYFRGRRWRLKGVLHELDGRGCFSVSGVQIVWRTMERNWFSVGDNISALRASFGCTGGTVPLPATLSTGRNFDSRMYNSVSTWRLRPNLNICHRCAVDGGPQTVHFRRCLSRLPRMEWMLPLGTRGDDQMRQTHPSSTGQNNHWSCHRVGSSSWEQYMHATRRVVCARKQSSGTLGP